MGQEQTALTQQAAKEINYSSAEKTPTSPNLNNTEAHNDQVSFQKLKLVLGFLSGILMPLAWATSISCAQALDGFVPAFELNCLRFAPQLLITAAVVFHQKLQVPADRKQRVFLVVYAVLASLNNLQYYEASIYLPVGVLGGAEATCMLVLASVVSIAFCEKCFIPVPVSVMLSISGLVCLTQPSFLFKDVGPVAETNPTPWCTDHVAAANISALNATTALSNNFTRVPTLSTDENWVLSDQTKGILLIVGSSSGYVINLAIRSRTLLDVNVFIIMTSLSLVGTTLSALTMLCLETPTFPTKPTCILLVVGHSLSAAVASCLGNVAIKFVTPVIYSLMSSLQLVFLLIAQYTALKNVNPGHRNWLEIVGAVLVFAGSVFGSFYTLYKQWTNEKLVKVENNRPETDLR